MYDMIRNIEFTNITNEFLDYLNKDIESIRKYKLIRISCENYQKLVHDNITQTYKKAPRNAIGI